LTEFTLPTGVYIRWRTDRAHKLQGWTIEINTINYLYSDGTHGGLPRNRAFLELGLERGEDDLETDLDWKKLEEKTLELASIFFMSLEDAWRLVRKYGYANRMVSVGEEVMLGGKEVLVTHTYDEAPDSCYVRVQTSDGLPKVCRLSDLQL
jgi:hypothetical protein